MTRRFTLVLIALNILLLAAVAWLIAGRSQSTLTADAAVSAEPPLQYLMLGPADFGGETSEERYRKSADLLQVTFPVLPPDTPVGTGRFVAPVHLPQGAIIVSLKTRWSDRNPDTDLKVTLTSSGFPDVEAIEMANVESSGAGGVGTTETNTIDGNPVDNANRHYSVHLDFSTDPFLLDLFDVRIGYTVPTLFLPSIKNGVDK